MSSSAPAASSVLTPHRPVDDPVAPVRSLSKVYGHGSGVIKALDAVNVDIARAQFIAIIGSSGSGKSTLMHCLVGLDSTTSGEIMLDGDMISSIGQRRLIRLCRERIGFIFQSFNLVSTLTTAENITLPPDITRKKVSPQRSNQMIDAVGLRECLSHRPAEFSGDQVQRMACARALVGESAVVFTDEPTGNLGSHSINRVLEILRRGVGDLGQSVVMMTHEPEVAAWADIVIFLRDGHAVAQLDDPDRDRVLDTLRGLSEIESVPTTAPQSDSAVRGA